MYLNNIDFPNQILDAIQEDKLVVFAGAGASMGEPTSLPNFVKLTKVIAEGTGRNIKKNEPCEVFLGSLMDEGIDVNGIAASILSNACLKHNDLHEAIVDLFLSPEKVKIVTTNYDQMFEQVLGERDIFSIPVYSSPALPLGNDITGIIHIHGNVSDPKYMVVTDEDFGRAYLTEGYVARFLVKLFESYTVLFIGYSYNDTILRYLTRAMSRHHSVKRYILTDDTKSDWKSFGISPICYPEKSHADMRACLIKLGNYAKKGLCDWRNQFIEIADAPPRDLTVETEIDYCLENVERSRVLANYIGGSEWLELLDRKDTFSCCFSELLTADDNGILWAKWLCEKFVGNDDNSLMLLFAKHGNHYSSLFSKLLLSKIVQEKNNLNDDCFKKYITLLDQHLRDPWIIGESIEIAYERQLYHLSLHLFEKLFSLSIKLEKSPWEENIESSHSMVGDYYWANRTWELINKNVVSLYASEVVSFVQRTIEDLHYQYVEMGQATDKKEPWSMAMLVIEDRAEEHSKDSIHVLVRAFLQANKELDEKDASKHYLMRGINSDSILLRKIALRALRESTCYSDDEKISILCDKELTWFVEGKEQVFLLTQDTFTKASLETQNRFLNMIEAGPNDYGDERDRQYAIYNWCVWLQRIYPENERIKYIEQQILKKYEFAPREHPERNFEESYAVWTAEKSPVSIQKMLEMSIEEMTDLLVDYRGDVFEGPTREGLLNTFFECIKGDVQWAKKVIEYFYIHKIDNAEIWNCLFRGLEEADLSIDEALSLCCDFTSMVDVLPDVQGLAHCVLKFLRNNEIQKKFKEYELILFGLSLKLWEWRSTTEPSPMRLIGKTLNTATGLIIMCWIYMTSYSDDVNVPELYKTKFEEALQLNSWEREVAICILAGHFNFLCNRDRAWCMSRFEPMLTGNNKMEYVCAWEGVVYYSRRISKDTADILSPIYLKAVKNINWIEGEAREGFIELYLTLLIFVVKSPTLKYIPELYNASSEEIKNQFVSAIGHRLRNMDEESKSKWWNSWLMHFLENRKSNKPVELLESECCSLFRLLPRLDFVIDDAIRILCKGSLPSGLDVQFWYQLNEKHLAFEHSQSVAKLLIALLGSIKDIDYGEHYIIQIASELHGLEEREKIQLQEALLKHNINVSLN